MPHKLPIFSCTGKADPQLVKEIAARLQERFDKIMATRKPGLRKTTEQTGIDKLTKENERLKIKIELLEEQIEKMRSQPISYEAYRKMDDDIANWAKR